MVVHTSGFGVEWDKWRINRVEGAWFERVVF